MEKDLSYRLMGCFYKVRNLYSGDHREKVYDEMLGEVLKEEGLNFADKPQIPLYSLQTGKKISFIVPDKLVENKIIVELKAKPFCNLDDINQVREYLKITEFEIIYLVNFGEKILNQEDIFIQTIISHSSRRQSICDLWDLLNYL